MIPTANINAVGFCYSKLRNNENFRECSIISNKTLNVQISLRNDTAANWKSKNPVLTDGELGIETDTHLIKVGDGTTAWSNLSYIGTTNSEHANVATNANVAAKVESILTLKNVNNTTVTYDGSSAVDLSAGVYYSAESNHSKNTDLATNSSTVVGSYSGNGGLQSPDYFGKNKVSFLMSNLSINGDTNYKNWMYMDCYNGNDVGGTTAIGIDRQSNRTFIARANSDRGSWVESAELITSANISSQSVTNATNSTNASNANTVDWLSVHGGRNNEANKIVRTDGNGYIQAGYINSSNGDERKTAELAKYMENCWIATKVTFCNEFADIAAQYGISYNELRECWLADERVSPSHTYVYPDKPYYDSRCLKKDIPGLITSCEKDNIDTPLMRAVDTINKHKRNE